MHEVEDIELLRSYAREQAQDAFAELVRRHLDLVYTIALRRCDGQSDLAADVAQQTFVTLAREARRLEEHPALAGWLFSTARHLALTAIRSEHSRKQREIAHAMHADLTKPEPTPDWDAIRPHLDELIDQLDERGRDALVRRFFAGQRFSEIGAALHVSEDAARMRVDRALERLRELLARRGLTSTTAALGTLLAALPTSAAPAGLAVSVALASAVVAPAASTTASAILSFMSTTKTVGVMVGLAALVASLGVYRGRQADEATTALHGLTEQADAASRKSNASQSEATPAAKRVMAGTAAKQGVESFVPVPMTLEEEQALLTRIRAIKPDVRRDSAIMSNRFRVRARFQGLYAALGLGSEAIERFEMEAAQKGLTFAELIGTPEQQRMHLNSDLRWMDKIVTETLGAEYAPRFRDYFATSDLRAVAGDLAADTYYTESPLTAAQADQLVQTCAECRRPEADATHIDPALVDWPAVLARTETFLTHEQTQALRAGMAKRLFDFEFERETGLPLRRPVRGL